MSAQNHPDYEEEKERFDYTLSYVDETLDKLAVEEKRLANVVRDMQKHFDSADADSYTSLMMNTMFQDRAILRLKSLNYARLRPYFARIDFKEGEREPEKLYIGKMSLMKEEDKSLLIVDWRAPISNLYYEGRLGKASYECPDGRINGDLLLKRQYSIDGRVLREIFDIDITTNDEFLQSYLGASADNRLKDIVSTIQVEQNKVIRADMWNPLIVQGVAGSGKTTIALHRIAYLIYTFEKSFSPENFMIIAPNRLFLDYISDILPELGVDKVKQTTYDDFAMEILGRKFKIKDQNEKLVGFVENNKTEKDRNLNRLIIAESKLKSSFILKEALDKYMKIIEKDFVPKEDFKLGDYVVIPYEEIKNLFFKEYYYLPFEKRIENIKKHMRNTLKFKKAEILDSMEIDRDSEVSRVKARMADSEDRRSKIIKIFDKYDGQLKKINNLSKTAVKKYISNISNIDVFDYYKKFLTDERIFDELLKGKADDECIEFTRSYSKKIFDEGYIETEDLAPLIYLKYSIYGVDERIRVRHIAIDEAQDISVFGFYVIKKIVYNCSFTILGDLSQGIHYYRGTRDWDDLIKYVFDGKSSLLKLEQCYRTTVEIMQAANKVIKYAPDRNVVLAKPVIRHGHKVEIIKKNNLDDTVKDIDAKIKGMIKAGFKSAAIICKTMKDCLGVYSKMKGAEYGPYVITGKEKEYRSGIVIVPSYLSKGLEFDAVFIYNASESEYKMNELDIKLLYVCMTRPLHKLFIYYKDKLSPLLKDV